MKDHAQIGYDILTYLSDERLVYESPDLHDVAVLRLRDEFGDGADVVDRALRVRDSHNAIKEIDLARLAGVVVA